MARSVERTVYDGTSTPSRRLSKSRIVQETLTLIESAGIDKFSIRNLASSIGSSPMSLYHHFPSRQALLEVAADAMYANFTTSRSGTWEERLTEITWDAIRLEIANPWINEVLVNRGGSLRAATPNIDRVEVSVKELFEEAGFTREDAVLAAVAWEEFLLGSWTGLAVRRRVRAWRREEAGELPESAAGVAAEDSAAVEESYRAFHWSVLIDGLRVRLDASKPKRTLFRRT